ncbi:hypothetical protein OLEAN_C01460 [Oleispira antarctica RB-8]|uniref:Uncharacterized protein n=1 Tax=Oleispira antarctica RB-8 TaxID=698738 RepID=R4YJG1_OLEAN|nr:hypothetical protein OLEAN_C01460 [Oleispira antarctica RB-8]
MHRCISINDLWIFILSFYAITPSSQPSQISIFQILYSLLAKVVQKNNELTAAQLKQTFE